MPAVLAEPATQRGAVRASHLQAKLLDRLGRLERRVGEPHLARLQEWRAPVDGRLEGQPAARVWLARRRHRRRWRRLGHRHPNSSSSSLACGMTRSEESGMPGSAAMDSMTVCKEGSQSVQHVHGKMSSAEASQQQCRAVLRPAVHQPASQQQRMAVLRPCTQLYTNRHCNNTQSTHPPGSPLQ